VARPFHGRRQAPLMFSTGTGLPAWADATVLGHVPPQCIDIFVVDGLNLVYTEGTDPAAPEPSPSTTIISHCFLQLGAITVPRPGCRITAIHAQYRPCLHPSHGQTPRLVPAFRMSMEGGDLS
jgi:hypothetical protein